MDDSRYLDDADLDDLVTKVLDYDTSLPTLPFSSNLNYAWQLLVRDLPRPIADKLIQDAFTFNWPIRQFAREICYAIVEYRKQIGH